MFDDKMRLPINNLLKMFGTHALITDTLLKIMTSCELSKEEGWLLYRLETVKRVLEQGTLWDHLFSVILVMNSEYQEDVTKHFKHLRENHQATLDFLKDLRQTPGFCNYHPILNFFSYWKM